MQGIGVSQSQTIPYLDISTAKIRLQCQPSINSCNRQKDQKQTAAQGDKKYIFEKSPDLTAFTGSYKGYDPQDLISSCGTIGKKSQQAEQTQSQPFPAAVSGQR